MRARKEDIPVLVRAFLRHFSKINDKPVLDITADAMNTLLGYDWPGNIRELRNVVERLIILGGNEISKNDVKAFASK